MLFIYTKTSLTSLDFSGLGELLDPFNEQTPRIPLEDTKCLWFPAKISSHRGRIESMNSGSVQKSFPENTRTESCRINEEVRKMNVRMKLHFGGSHESHKLNFSLYCSNMGEGYA